MRQVTHALLTRPPLDRISASTDLLSFDLHVLSTPPAFILSQIKLSLKICPGFRYDSGHYLYPLLFLVCIRLASVTFFLKFFIWNFRVVMLLIFQGSLLSNSSATTSICYHIQCSLSTTFLISFLMFCMLSR